MRRLGSRARLGLASLVFASLLAAAPSLAKEPSKAEMDLAKDMVKEAQGEAKAGKCEDAIQILKQAVAIHETAEAMLSLGDCQAKTGAFKDALASYKRGEEVADPKKDKARLEAIAKGRADVEARMPKLEIMLPSGVEGVEVKLDGKAVAASELGKPLAIDPGQHSLEASAPGHRSFSKTFEAGDNEAVSVEVSLELVKGEGKKAPPARSGPPVLTYVAAGAALVLVGAGIGAFVGASSNATAGAEACKKVVTCDAGQVGAVRALDGAALGLWIGAGVALGAAAALWALAPKKDKAKDKAETSLVVGPGSVFVVGSF